MTDILPGLSLIPAVQLLSHRKNRRPPHKIIPALAISGSRLLLGEEVIDVALLDQLSIRQD